MSQQLSKEEVIIPVARHEQRTRGVVVVMALMMSLELVIGHVTGSLALVADGWHMATHVAVLGLSALAYWFARTRAHRSEFTFGTGKVYALSGYTSAVSLALVAVWMVIESAERVFAPTPVRFADALPVAVLGLAVNLVSIRLLGHDGRGAHAVAEDALHEHAFGHHHDHNLRAAYMHVLADAFTSVLAIAALLTGRYLGWYFLDPVMGVVGSLVIANWSFKLCRDAARQLLDATPSPTQEQTVRTLLEDFDDVRVVDLHLWDLGPGTRSCIVSLVTSQPRETSFYRNAILAAVPLAHLSVEVHPQAALALPSPRSFPMETPDTKRQVPVG